jgi:hypothetical protein
VVNADAIIADVDRMQPVALRGEILSLCSYVCSTSSSFPSDDAKRDARQVRHCDRPGGSAYRKMARCLGLPESRLAPSGPHSTISVIGVVHFD